MESLAVAVAVQVACQLFKVVYYSIARGRLEAHRFVSAGGMPSAHAAFVTALAVSVGLRSGFVSDIFAVSAVFSLIVIYDAYRLRGTVERHARVLQALVAAHPEVPAEELNDLVGHTLPEIGVGIAVGGGLAAAAGMLLR
jgi:acid phosphatase family membrane protein YuiD